MTCPFLNISDFPSWILLFLAMARKDLLPLEYVNVSTRLSCKEYVLICDRVIAVASDSHARMVVGKNVYGFRI